MQYLEPAAWLTACSQCPDILVVSPHSWVTVKFHASADLMERSLGTAHWWSQPHSHCLGTDSMQRYCITGPQRQDHTPDIPAWGAPKSMTCTGLPVPAMLTAVRDLRVDAAKQSSGSYSTSREMPGHAGSTAERLSRLVEV